MDDLNAGELDFVFKDDAPDTAPDEQTPTADDEGAEVEGGLDDDQSVEDVETGDGEDDGGDDESKGETKQKVVFTPEQQEIFNKRAQKLVEQKYEQEREKNEIARKLEETRKLLEEYEAQKNQLPEVPPMPSADLAYEDPERFAEEVKARDMVIAQRAMRDAQIEAQKAQEQIQAQRQAQEAQAAQQKQVQEYYQNAKSIGINQEAADRDANLVGPLLSPDVRSYIASLKEGPAVVNYLAKNSQDLDSIRGMNPISAGVYLANNIVPKLANAKKTTQAPKPAHIVNGGPTPEKEHPALKGVKFE